MKTFVMKMKDKKEKIKAGAVALLLIAGTSAIVAGATISAVQGAKTETEVEKLTKAMIKLESKMYDKITALVKENASLRADLETVVKNLVGEIKYTEKLNKIFPKWRKYFVMWLVKELNNNGQS